MEPTQLASRVSFVYVTIGIVWILLSDSLTAAAFEGALYGTVQSVKGGAFVLATGVILFFFTRSRARKLLFTREESEEHHLYSKTLFESSPVGLAVARLDGQFLDANDAFLSLMGWDEADVGPYTIRDVTPEEYTEIEDRRLEALAATGVFGPYEKEYVRKDDTRVPVRVFSRGIRLAGEDLILICAEDISDQKRYEQRLITARDGAEEASQLKSAFLRTVSHELRTPLTGIIGYASVLQEELVGELRAFAAEIDESGHRLLKTLTNVLDFARLEAGDYEFVTQQFDAVERLGPVIDRYEKEARAKGLAFRTVRETESCRMTGDASAVLKIIEALLDNAVKFTTDGEITVRLSDTEGCLKAVVRDTGAGISPAFMEKIFSPFTQESGGLARAYQGNGLGLALARELTRCLGGDIRAESRRGAGSTFTVAIPRQAKFSRPGAVQAGARVNMSQ